MIKPAKHAADRILFRVLGPRWLQFRARRAWDRHARERSLAATSSHDAADTDTYWQSGERDWGLVHGLATRVGIPAHALAIEIGCGLGRITRQAAPQFERVIGLDISPEILKQARLQASAPNISYESVGGEARIPAGAGSADLVYAWTVFRHMSKELFARYLVDVHRVLKPGGSLVFEALIRGSGRGRQPTPSDANTEREYTTEELRAHAAQHGYVWAADQAIPSLTQGTHNLVIAWQKPKR